MFAFAESNDKYGYFHLTKHLSRAGKINELFNLVTNSDWKKNSGHFDPSNHLYQNDINISIDSIKQHILSRGKHVEGIGLPQKLSWLTALCWISAQIGQQAIQASHFVLETLSRLGETQQSVDRAKSNPDPIRRAESLIWIGLSAFELGGTQMAKRVWDNAYELLKSSPPDLFNENLEVLGDLVYVLSLAGETNKARIIASELETITKTEADGAGGITSGARYAQVKSWASVYETSKALEYINQFTDSKDQLKALWEAATAQANCAHQVNDELLAVANTLIGQLDEDPLLAQYAEVLAISGYIEESWKIFDKEPSQKEKAWILRNYTLFLFSQKDPKAEIYCKRSVEIAESVSDPISRLELCAGLILGKRRDFIGHNFIGLLPVMQEDFDGSSDQLTVNMLSQLSLAFCILGDSYRAGLATEKAINFGYVTEDWDEAYTFMEFIKEFGQTRDTHRISQVWELATQRKDLWQKAEILVTILSSLIGTENNVVWEDIVNNLKEISDDNKSLTNHPNALGALVIWKSLPQLNNLNAEALGTLNQALVYISQHDDQADMFAYLALTLVQNGLFDYANRAIEKSFDALDVEGDPNTLARVIGTITQVSVYLGNLDMLVRLEDIASKISDEWLQAEGLFWISGALGLLGFEEKSKDVFAQAFQMGMWQEVDLISVNMSWKDLDNADAFFSAFEYIGWPSTKVAMIFSWLAILLIHPRLWHLELGIRAIDFIPEEYSEKRALCIYLLASKLDQISTDKEHIVEIYSGMLDLSKDRHTGEVWAALRGCFPYLKKHMGDEFFKLTWDELFHVRNLFD